jgi:hypothetical protein
LVCYPAGENLLKGLGAFVAVWKSVRIYMINRKIMGSLTSLGNPLKRFGSLCGLEEECEKINDK